MTPTLGRSVIVVLRTARGVGVEYAGIVSDVPFGDAPRRVQLLDGETQVLAIGVAILPRPLGTLVPVIWLPSVPNVMDHDGNFWMWPPSA